MTQLFCFQPRTANRPVPSRSSLHSWLTHFLPPSHWRGAALWTVPPWPDAPVTTARTQAGKTNTRSLFFFIRLWLNQIKPDSFSSFTRKLREHPPAPSLFKTARRSRLGFPPSWACLHCLSSRRPVLKLHAVVRYPSDDVEGTVHVRPLACLLPSPGISCALVALRCRQQLSARSFLLLPSVHGFTTSWPHQPPHSPAAFSWAWKGLAGFPSLSKARREPGRSLRGLALA